MVKEQNQEKLVPKEVSYPKCLNSFLVLKFDPR